MFLVRTNPKTFARLAICWRYGDTWKLTTYTHGLSEWPALELTVAVRSAEERGVWFPAGCSLAFAAGTSGITNQWGGKRVSLSKLIRLPFADLDLFIRRHKMCFPESDDTERLGIQHWHLLAPVVGQVQRMPSTGGKGGEKQKFSDFLSFLSTANLSPKYEMFDRLACGLAANPQQDAESSTLMPLADLCSLEALPAEILALILNTGLLSMQDTLSLGSCSQTMWRHVWEQIQDDCRRAAAPWAGTSIMAVTNWLKELPDTLKDMLHDIEKELGQSGSRNLNLGRSAARDWLAEVVSTSTEVTTKGRGTEWLEAGEGLSSDRRSSLMEAATTHRSVAGEEWVLRNLTTSELVHLEIRGSPEQPAVMIAGSDSVSLDQLLLLNICWGVDSSELIRKNRLGFLRGKWAGHSFDIVRKDGNIAGDWEDVTAKILSHTTIALREPQGDEQ